MVVGGVLLEIKKRLQWLRHFDVLIASKKQELTKVRSEIHRTAKFLESNEQKERSDSLTVRIVDKSEEISRDIIAMYHQRDVLIGLIDSLSDPTEALIVRLFYLDSLPWKAIQRKLHFSVKQLQRKRDKALEELEKR